MPYSYSLFKNEVKLHLIQNISKEAMILDVGAGAGSYGKLLHDHFPHIHGIEIYDKYYEMFKIEQWYEKLFSGDIITFDYDKYDYIIFGDIIEHLETEEAQKLIKDCTDKAIKILVTVPYLFEQGEEYGNKYEIHKQSDLTQKIVLERYPELRYLIGDTNYGYFINYETS